jgi:hypothetical protein
MFTLTALQLRFTCEAVTPIRLNGYSAGSNLRGALGNVMRRAYCPEADHFSARNLHSAASTRQPDPQHAATCPVCWLLAANEHPGEERRGYALVPPQETCQVFIGQSSNVVERGENLTGLYSPGQRFDFGLTLFGDALRFLPYFILAVPEMGRSGVGAGRGQFVLRSVTAIDLLEGADQIVLAEGESLVHVPDRLITAERIERHCERLLAKQSHPQSTGDCFVTEYVPRNDGFPDRLSVNFITPTRLIDEERLVKAPDFGVLFKRLLERLDELNQQFGGGERRAPQEVQGLQTLANQVRLIEAQTQWIELQSGSSRSGRTTWLSGFVGLAMYAAPFQVWRALLPWLVWGQVAQAGKDVVKGNGVYDIVIASEAKQSPVGRNEIASSRTTLLAIPQGRYAVTD